LEEVLISSQGFIPGWSVASDRGVTVKLEVVEVCGLVGLWIDVDRGVESKKESLGFVNRIQNLRKDMGFLVSSTNKDQNPIC